jgi:hypothetical protein
MGWHGSVPPVRRRRSPGHAQNAARERLLAHGMPGVRPTVPGPLRRPRPASGPASRGHRTRRDAARQSALVVMVEPGGLGGLTTRASADARCRELRGAPGTQGGDSRPQRIRAPGALAKVYTCGGGGAQVAPGASLGRGATPAGRAARRLKCSTRPGALLTAPNICSYPDLVDRRSELEPSTCSETALWTLRTLARCSTARPSPRRCSIR